MSVDTSFDRALVTGGAGFIGSHLADRLVEAGPVTVYDNFSAGNREHVPAAADVVEADVRNDDRLSAAVESADVVFHQAGLVSVTATVERPAESHAVNIDPTVTILEAARGTDTRVVLASSAAIYGQPRTVPIPETHPKDPTSPYGLEKLTADHYCRLYHDLYGLETVALRYFNVYGPRQQGGDYSGVISVFRDQAAAGDPLTVHGDGTQTRDFVHVDDVVRANLAAATTDDGLGQAFNIGTGDSISIRDLAHHVRDVMDAASEVRHTDPREGDIERSRADIDRARTVLGYEPTHSIRAGLEAYLGGFP